MRDRLVFAAREAPFPLLSGAPIRRHRLLLGLAESFETTLVTFGPNTPPEAYRQTEAELKELLPGVRVVLVEGLAPDRDRRRTQLRSLAWTRSWEFGRYRFLPYRTMLEQTVARVGAALVHLDDPGVAQWGPVAGTTNVYAPHNVEHRILEGTARSSRGLRGLFAALESRKLAHEERRIWRSMPLCLAVSEEDAAVMRAGGARRVELCPNGADAVEPLPLAVRRRDEPLRVLFVGVVHYQPNFQGITWFIDEVLPLVRRRLACVFDVVGALHNAPPPSPPGVRFHGGVPSLEPFYRDADVVIVPVRYGSGTRMKVLEAMAYGRPVVSTRVGTQGLPLSPDVHYLAADDATHFANAVAELGDVASRANRELPQMLTRARRAVEPLLWPNIVKNLARLYQTEIDSFSGRRAGVGTSQSSTRSSDVEPGLRLP